MKSPFWFYGRFLALFVVVSLMVGFNFLTWGFHRADRQPDWHVTGARPERGLALIREYGCGACHTLPGTTQAPQAPRTVGPSLERVELQMYIVGTLPNTPHNLMRWIQDPEQIRPHTAMPNLGVGPDEARDIAAYIYDPSLTRALP